MLSVRSWQAGQRYEQKISLALGSFDAIHYGHQALLSQRVEGLEAWVLYFKQAPQSVYQSNFLGMVRSERQRLKIFEDLQLSGAFGLDFSTEISKMSGVEFLHALYQQLNIGAIFVGEDFRFGHGARSGVSDLLDWAKPSGIKVTIVPLMPDEQTSIKYSSSALREAVRSGNFHVIEQSSGYPYALDLRDSVREKRADQWFYHLRTEQVLPDAMGTYHECVSQGEVELVNEKLVISTDPLEQLVLRQRLL